MTPVKTGKTVQLAVRVPFRLADRIAALAERMSQPGLEIGLADVMRLSMERGLAELEAELPKTTSKRRR